VVGYGTRKIPNLRTLLALIALGQALALAGCGGGSENSTEPLIPRAVAADLAAKSDAVADALDAGDECGAAGLADQLKAAVETYVNGGRIPPAFQQELTETATDLQNNVNCPPEAEEHGEGEDKGKKNGHDDETTTDETTTDLTTTLGTTTEGG
jgi:hypothetical protein